MFIQAPFQLPDGFLTTFGYPGERRFVALYWEPSGDEACYDDGISYACGCCDNWFYLGFIRQLQVSQWLDTHGIHLGSSDESATHWLVADASTGNLYAASRTEAFVILNSQQLPG